MSLKGIGAVATALVLVLLPPLGAVKSDAKSGRGGRGSSLSGGRSSGGGGSRSSSLSSGHRSGSSSLRGSSLGSTRGSSTSGVGRGSSISSGRGRGTATGGSSSLGPGRSSGRTIGRGTSPSTSRSSGSSLSTGSALSGSRSTRVGASRGGSPKLGSAPSGARGSSSIGSKTSPSRPSESFRPAPRSTFSLAPGKARAVDGDTFHANGQKYRVRGIDTPERGQPRAEAAKQRLSQLLSSGNVTVVPRAADKYGRTVADVYVNGRNVADVMKAEGLKK